MSSALGAKTRIRIRRVGKAILMLTSIVAIGLLLAAAYISTGLHGLGQVIH